MGVRRGEGKYPAPLGLRQIQIVSLIMLLKLLYKAMVKKRQNDIFCIKEMIKLKKRYSIP